MAPLAHGFRTGPALEMDFDGLAETTERLADLGARAEDMRPATRQVKELLLEGHRKQFRSKGSYLGTPWPDNAPATVEKKGRSGIPSLSSTMVFSGDLQQAAEGGKGSRSRATKSMASAGIALFYARFHINPRRASMPARPVVGIGPATESRALDIVENHLLGRRV